MNDEYVTEIAKAAYHEYGSVTEFKNYQGLPMPEWEQLTPKIQEAWKASVCYVLRLETGDEPDNK